MVDTEDRAWDDGGESRSGYVGTVAGVALILSVMLTLIVLFKVLPQRDVNDDIYTKISELENAIDAQRRDIARVAAVASADNYRLEMAELRDTISTLDALQAKAGDGKLEVQVDTVKRELQLLMDQLEGADQETPASPPEK